MLLAVVSCLIRQQEHLACTQLGLYETVVHRVDRYGMASCKIMVG